jgi:hypothetical protein
MKSNEITVLCLSAAGVALSYSILSQSTILRSRVAAVISIAFGMITYIYLKEHPKVLANTVERIVLAILGGLVALALFIRRKASGS